MYAVDGGAWDKADEEGDGSQGPTYASIWQAIPPTKAIILYIYEHISWTHIWLSLLEDR